MLAALPLPHASAQTFGGTGGAGSTGPGGVSGGLGMAGGNAPAGSSGGGGGGGPALANAASGVGQPGGAGDGLGGAGGAGGANGFDGTSGPFDGTIGYSGGNGGFGFSGGTGGGGAGGGAGGYGAVLQGGGAFGLTSQIAGGNGGTGGGNGGSVGAPGSGAGGDGGIGVYLAGAGTTLTSSGNGFVIGGNGGNAGSGYGSGNAGAGGKGGAGIYVTGGAALFNSGYIQGGLGGTGGSAQDAVVPGAGGAGGDGVTLANGALTNLAGGSIQGGGGFFGGGEFTRNASGGYGPAGASGNGGNGVTVLTRSQVTNNASITGGSGAPAADFGAPPGNGGALAGNGGTGIAFLAGGGLLNTGTVTGGDGSLSVVTTSGIGGPGVSGSNLVITNAGTIAGGQGGVGGQAGVGPAAGGVGVLGSNLTIDNTGGTIIGGTSADGTSQAYAVQFTGGANYASYAGSYTGGIYVAGGSFQPSLPGSAVGTPLAVTGPLVFAQGSIYAIRVTPTATDRVAVGASGFNAGTATLGGATVAVAAGGGYIAPGTRYTILSAMGGISGTFSGVTTNLAFFRPILSYDADDVFLTAAYSYVIPGLTRNQRAVASGLTVASALNGGGPVLTALNQLTVPQAQAAFDSLSGEGIAAAQNVAHRSTQLFTSSIFDQTTFYGSDRAGANQIVLTAPQPGRSFQALAPSGGLATTFQPSKLSPAPIRELADLPTSRPQFVEVAPAAPVRTWRAWGTGFGASEDVRSNQAIGFAAQQNSIVGGSVGVDYQVAPGALVGVAAGGTDGQFNVPNRATFGSTTGGHVAGYTLASFGPFYGAASLSGSFFTNRTTRSVAGFGGLAGETERGSFNSREVRARLEAGRGFAVPSAFGALTVTPFAALEIAQLRSDGFAEQTIAGGPGGPGLLALNVSGQSAADVPAFAGLRFSSVTALGNGVVLKPVFQAAYVHNFSPERQVFAGLNSLPGAVFLVDGARPARDAAQVKAGGELLIGARTSVFANFDGEFAKANQLYGGKGGIKVLF